MMGPNAFHEPHADVTAGPVRVSVTVWLFRSPGEHG